MKKKLGAILVVFAVLAIVSFIVSEYKHNKKAKDPEPSTEAVVQNPEDYCTFDDIDNELERLMVDDSVRKDMKRLVDPLTRSELATFSYFKEVISVMGLPSSVYDSVLKNDLVNNYISKEEFYTIYDNICSSGAIEGFVRKDVYVFQYYTKTIDGETKNLIYDREKEYEVGDDFPKEYVGRIIDMYLLNDSIVKMNGYGDSTMTFRNAWLLSTDSSSATLLFEGVQHTYSLAVPEDTKIPTPGVIVSVQIGNSGIQDIRKQTDIKEAKVSRVTEQGLWVENQGTYTCADDIKIYNAEKNVFCETSQQILAGYETVDLVFEGGQVIGVVIDKPLISDNIRVIISNDDYTSYDMERVIFQCDKDYTITYPDETTKEFLAGESQTIRAEGYNVGNTIRITPSDGGKTQITSVLRGYGNPSYEGVIELVIVEDDKLHIINELPIEQYLYSVVSSEMPVGYQAEALKAQAVCARGYAYMKIRDGSFSSYRAHLDDSSLCQMYNNAEATDATILAVKETYGVVPVRDGEAILPLYYSTSSGMTCSNEEIWGGTSYSYFQSNLETLDRKSLDLSAEEDFQAFMKDSSDYEIIDRDQPYYRWSITFTENEMTEAINQTLEARLKMSSDTIKVKNSRGNFVAADEVELGDVVEVSVIERSKSGVVQAIEIEGTENTIRVYGQSNVRSIITPVNQEIVRQDEQVVTGWTSLPSPYYYVVHSGNEYKVIGGGFGHGCGMSQVGANVLASEGNNYKYILRHYYSGIDFAMLYQQDNVKEDKED